MERTRTRRSAPAAHHGSVTFGLQRVLAVRVAATQRGLIADAVGVSHRRPVVQRISMATAADLVARGVPVQVQPAAKRRLDLPTWARDR